MELAATKRPALGWALLIGSSILFGLNASTSKVLVHAGGISPEIMVIYRSAASAVLAGLAVLLGNRKAFAVNRREWPALLVFGVVGIGVMQWSYTNAVSRLPVGISLLFEYTAAIWVPLIAWLVLKQRASNRLWIGAGVAVAGLLVVSQIWASKLDPVGVFFGFLTAAAVSFYFLIAEHTQSSRDTMSTLFYTMTISTTFWLIVSHPSPSAIPNLTNSITLGGNLGNLTVPTWALLLWLGVFGSFIPMLMGYWSLRHISATAAGIGSTSEVIAAFVFGWLWLQEGLSGIQLIGAVFVLIGIAIAQTSRKVAIEPSMIAGTGEVNGEH